jgi:hypothetical protein
MERCVTGGGLKVAGCVAQQAEKFVRRKMVLKETEMLFACHDKKITHIERDA